MSYDLYFLSPSAAAVPKQEALKEYFLSRPNYGQTENDFWYGNEDTGIYFSFHWGQSDADGALEATDPGEPPEDSRPSDGLTSAGLAFELNYMRPHTFGLEAEIEVSALVKQFGLFVDDPQMSGMGRGPYSREGFLTGWNAGNRFGYSAMIAQDAAVTDLLASSLPAAQLERNWRWNLKRSRLQEELGQYVFVPKIMALLHEGGVKSFVVWGDGMPTALPDTDLIVVVRESLAPRRFFRRKPDRAFATPAELAPIRQLGRRVGGEEGYWLFDSAVPPAPILDFFKSRIPWTGEFKGVPTESVLTRETLVEAMAAPRLKIETINGE